MNIDRRSLLAATGGAALATPAGARPATKRAGDQRFEPPAGPRSRIVYVNDLSGDIDGLFATVHTILSPSTELRAIVGSGPGNDNATENARNAAALAAEMLAKMGLSGKYPVHQGAVGRLRSPREPIASAGTQAIIDEARRTDTKLPLYVTVGGGLTEVASALMLAPEIADRFTLVWIGGGSPHPQGAKYEPNFGIDPLAARYVFNQTNVPIWHVSSEVYQTCVVSNSELLLHVASCGEIGRWLFDQVKALSAKFSPHFNTGETWTLGDNPLVVLTALNDWVPSDVSKQGLQYKRTGSSSFDEMFAPQLDANGAATARSTGRRIRRYTSIDTRLMFGDFFAKLRLNS